MEERNFQFVSLTMAVILGILLTQTASALLADFELQNAKTILLLISLLIFLEMYIVLARYHQYLAEKYAAIYLFFDCFVGLLFVTFVQLIQDAKPGEIYFQRAPLVAAIIFAMLCVRQILTYRKINDLDSKLKEAGLLKKDLIIPMFADLVGLVVCVCIYMAEKNAVFVSISTLGWSWIAFILFIVYFLSVYVFKFTIRPSL